LDSGELSVDAGREMQMAANQLVALLIQPSGRQTHAI
jgi:hypothetical protein